MLKTVRTPHGRKFKFGRKQTIARGPRLSLGNYLLRTFPDPPPAMDYTPKALPFLNNVYGNDIAGDCTCAGIYHCKAVILANSGRPVTFAAGNVITTYKVLSGWNGIEDDPSDTGLDLPTVLNYAQSVGIPPGSTITGSVEIDGSDPQEVAAAINMFNCAYIGINLPQAWVDSMQTLKAGDVWDVAGDGLPENGHCVMSARYDEDGIIVDTWGLEILMTWRAVQKYVSAYGGGDIFALLDTDMLDVVTQQSPTGVNWTQLVSDFQSIGA